MSCIEQKTVLVTGISGLVGSYAAKALCAAGYHVVGLDWREPADLTGNRLTFRQINLLDDSDDTILYSFHPETILHCAAVLPAHHEGSEAFNAARSNRLIDKKMIRLCREINCQMIFASGTSIYGLNKQWLDEESPACPPGPYVAAKYETEQEICASLDRYTILRISSPYGRGKKKGSVLNVFLKRALLHLPLYYHGNGSREQDFISAEDIARAILCAVSNNGINEIFNIASGVPITMFELAKLIVCLVPGSKSFVEASGDPDSQEHHRARYIIQKSKEILGWTPTISLSQGISDLLAEKE
jgi:nucleoside-diphosphate-sugar epimerase